MRPAVYALFLLMPALRADGLADLRSALQKLPGTQSVKAAADCQVWSKQGKEKAPKIVQGRVAARLEDGPGGLKIGWDKADLDRAQAASKAKDEGPKQALNALDAEKAVDLLNAGKSLLEDLAKAQLQEDRPDAWQGRAARLLTFKLDVDDMDEDDKKHLKSYSHLLKIWMDADGTPLGFVDQMDLKGSFMLISFEMHHTATRAFVKAGDRLVAIRDESQDSGSGAGQGGQQKTVIALTL